jgi:hypothetical protein
MANKKYPKSEAIEDAQYDGQEAYVTWGDDLNSKKEALKSSSESLNEFNGIERSTARRTRLDFSNLDTNVSGRPGLTKSDYYSFRPDEAIPTQVKLIIRKAEDIYQRVGLVKNIIDLMGDFASQGITIVHPNKRVERFYRAWFKKISGKDRSERFLNNLYRTGNIVINKQYAKLNNKIIDKMYKATASTDIADPTLEDIEPVKKEIPWKYTFIDPVYVDVLGGSLASFATNKIYGVVLPGTLRKIINSPKNDAERNIVSQLPIDILEAAKTRRPYILNPEKTSVFHYKKDDWQIWAYPMIYAIMDDITIIEKLKLADMCALDGAVSNIRIFKLGNLEHRIAPTKAAASKLSAILGNNVGGGTMDLVWGPDIELLESNTNVHNFLGEGKYIPHLNSVYAGLGIPPTLTGTFGASGTTNNFISLKTLTQRLQYGRDVLVSFWEKEIEVVQKAMGFKYPAKIEFDRMDLSNEDAEKALLIQLADRNVISDELLQMRFGIDPSMEKVRINREDRDRKSDRMVQKSGPYYDANTESTLKKIALQLGLATPSQVGLELEPKKRGEMNAVELKSQFAIPKSPFGGGLGNPVQEAAPKGVPGQGRPKNSKDTQTRKTKDFKPRTGASLAIWANHIEDQISEIMNPHLLAFYNKDNLRKLSASESKDIEIIKTKLFFNVEPMSTVNEESLLNSLASIEKDNNIKDMYYAYQYWLKQIGNELNRPLTSEENKLIKASFYATVYDKNN